MSDQLAKGRDSYGRGRWGRAFDEFLAAQHACGLDPVDVERVATCAYLIGRADDSAAAWEQAFLAYERRRDSDAAVRCAFWASFVLLNRGELARGGGWVHRGRRLLAGGVDSVERGYLDYVESLRRVMEGDVAGAAAGFATAAATGHRFGSAELIALARVGQGRCLIRLGAAEAGIAQLDEALSVISAARISPTVVGDLYCTVIEGCHEVFDVRRAREWTEALSRWCDAQREIVLYQGQCLVHRAELLLFAGRWSQAAVEARRACEALTRPRIHPALGTAHYIRAELHRVRGEFADAEAAYGRASAYGREPQPGLALLRLAQGQVGEAVSTIRQAVAGSVHDPVPRVALLGPLVEISVAAGDVSHARRAADELTAMASTQAPVITALAAYANGSVLIAENQHRRARGHLRRAWTSWTELGAPYEAARTRVLMALAQHASGDELGASLELDAARSELRHLGAPIDQPVMSDHTGSAGTVVDRGLTPREVEVLRLLATGVSNREISAGLFISEKTVATHVSSILRKLGVRSRSAATAYAHQQDLL